MATRVFLFVILENYVFSYKTSQNNGPGMCFLKIYRFLMAQGVQKYQIWIKRHGAVSDMNSCNMDPKATWCLTARDLPSKAK